MRTCAVLLLLLPGIVFSHPCASCHPKEVDGYLRTSMGRSLRPPSGEPDGSYEHAKSDTRFVVRSNQYGLFQRMQHGGQNSDFRIDYVIGSGSHASCYLARVGDHLFESPICAYPGRGYAMAPAVLLFRTPLDAMVGKCGVTAIQGFALGHVARKAIAGARGMIGWKSALMAVEAAFPVGGRTGAICQERGGPC